MVHVINHTQKVIYVFYIMNNGEYLIHVIFQYFTIFLHNEQCRVLVICNLSIFLQDLIFT